MRTLRLLTDREIAGWMVENNLKIDEWRGKGDHPEAGRMIDLHQRRGAFLRELAAAQSRGERVSLA